MVALSTSIPVLHVHIVILGCIELQYMAMGDFGWWNLIPLILASVVMASCCSLSLHLGFIPCTIGARDASIQAYKHIAHSQHVHGTAQKG